MADTTQTTRPQVECNLCSSHRSRMDTRRGCNKLTHVFGKSVHAARGLSWVSICLPIRVRANTTRLNVPSPKLLAVPLQSMTGVTCQERSEKAGTCTPLGCAHRKIIAREGARSDHHD